MSQLTESFGYYDIGGLLHETDGHLEVLANDLGKKRLVQRNYGWEERQGILVVSPTDDERTTLVVPSKLPLTGALLAFLGLYDVGGSRESDGPIGFREKELNIHRFVNQMLDNVFQGQFIIQWKIHSERNFADAPRAKEARNLRREFLRACREVGIEVRVQNAIMVTPSRGGNEDRWPDYEQTLSGSEKFAVLWLKIVQDCTRCVLLPNYKVAWVALESSSFLVTLDVKSYLSQLTWRLGDKKWGCYEILSARSGRIEVRKASHAVASICAELPLTPLVFLMSGMYVVKGDTKRDHFFVFGEENAKIRVGLASSEAKHLRGFTRMLESLGDNLIRSWKVGVGFVGSLEVNDDLHSWALDSVPHLMEYREKLRRELEITGVRVSRVHIRATDSIDYYVIGLIRDLLFCPDKLEPHLKRRTPRTPEEHVRSA